MADDELNLEAENIMQPEAEAVAELTPTPVEEPVQQARITPLRSEPEAKAPPAERDWIAQPSARPADPVVDADRPLTLFERMMNISRDRKSVVWGKRGSGRVDVGGRRIF